MDNNEYGYSGWRNRVTWNVAVWINNDEGLYRIARECKNYTEFRDLLRSEMGNVETPDGVAWNDSGIDVAQLDGSIFCEGD